MADRRSLGWISEQARTLAASRARQGREWSLGQVCEHLALALEATQPRDSVQSPAAHRSVWSRGRQFVMKRALLLTGRFPNGVPSPERVVPSAAPDLDATLDRLELAIREFERAVDRPGVCWPDHPVLGVMNGRDWHRFHAIHAAHHFSFFRKAVSSGP